MPFADGFVRNARSKSRASQATRNDPVHERKSILPDHWNKQHPYAVVGQVIRA
jgi:hypothetical protein